MTNSMLESHTLNTQDPTRSLKRNLKLRFSKRSQSVLLDPISLTTLIISHLLVFISTSTESADLPTVIVRGFLNYRTTVDGTVLLFTPEAASGVESPPSISATHVSASIQPTSLSVQKDKFLPRSDHSTLSVPNLVASSSPTESRNQASTGSWQQHTPTPPLGSLSRSSSRGDASNEPISIIASSNESVDQLGGGKQSTPSVQSEEVVQNQPDTQVFQSRSGANAHVIGSSDPQQSDKREGSSGSWLAKRPSRGSIKPFPHGQSSLGIRRPALVGQSNEGSESTNRLKSGAVADPNAAIVLNSSFQNRLANASAKLRNRFKKPSSLNTIEHPVSGGSSSTTPRTPSSTTTTQLSSTNKSIQDHEASIHDGEKIEESKIEEIHQLVSSPNSTTPAVGSEDVLQSVNQEANHQSPNKPSPRTGDQRKFQPLAIGGDLASASMELSNGQLANAPPLNLDSFFQTEGSSTTTESMIEQPKKSNLNNNKLSLISPSFSSDIPSLSSSVLTPITVVAKSHEQDQQGSAAKHQEGIETISVSMQTVTKTYSTIMTSLKTRLVPLQVNSTTGIHTITEQYVITKMLTAYQTMPVGDFLLPEPTNTKAPFELFNVGTDNQSLRDKQEQPISAPSNFSPGASIPDSGGLIQPEQPISKSPNDWLHDFSNNNPMLGSQGSQNSNQDQAMAALLGQQQSQLDENQRLALTNLLAGSSNEPLDQLASSLDPTALLAAAGSDQSSLDSINVPDLNNPLILAAAIQNPQLAAVILAAQQLKFKQQRNKLLLNQANSGQQINPAIGQLQPSFSTTFSTTIKPSTYTARDTMYTTRLVSFKDGRTVRTRTVSEPGSVIEQIITTMATEVTPVTITIKPTAPMSVAQATQAPSSLNNANTIKNALIATQLANLLARRQQQINLQPSSPSPLGFSEPQANQLNALQQLLAASQQRQQSAKFQPNLQQLLQSMQQPSSLTSSSSSQSSTTQASNGSSDSSPVSGQKVGDFSGSSSVSATPSLPSIPSMPIATTLTSLHVRTYTVHNAFKTIYRTITSTEIITSTFSPMKATKLAG